MALTPDQLTIRLFEHDQDAEQRQDVLKDILEFYQQACLDGSPERVDDLLYSLDADCITETYLGGLLRFSLNFAHTLNNWYDFRDRAVQAMERRGDDPNDALYGLLAENILQGYEPSSLMGELLGLDMKAKS